MTTPNPFNRADYLLAAHTHRQLPPDGGREVAFAGRSNAGKLTHYAPEDAIYVYFRHDGTRTVMVALNRNPKAKELRLERFARFLPKGTSAREALTGKPVVLGETLTLPAKSATLLELQ